MFQENKYPAPVNRKGSYTILRLSIFALFIFSFIRLNAQTSFILEVNINVHEANKKLQGANVTVFRNGKEAGKKLTDKSGRAFIELLPNFDYLVKVSKEGYVSKSIEFNTKGVPEIYQESAIIYEINAPVELYPVEEGMDLALFEKPVGRFEFNQDAKDFGFDFAYSAEVKSELDASKEDFQKRLKEREIYDSLVSAANHAIAFRNYSGARAFVSEAKVLFPGDKTLDDKLLEIGRLEDDELRAKKKAESDARKKAEERARLRAEEEAKLRTIMEAKENELLEGQARREKYDERIKKADLHFNTKDYSAAKAAYQQALALYVEEKYPQNKIAEINAIQLEHAKHKEMMENPGKRKMSQKEMEIFRSDLAKKYPQGVTEEIKEESMRTITRRIVVKGNDANEYTRIAYSWGTYYFKNVDISISENIFNQETKK